MSSSKVREFQAEREPPPSPVGRAWFRQAAWQAGTESIELNPDSGGLVPF